MELSSKYESKLITAANHMVVFAAQLSSISLKIIHFTKSSAYKEELKKCVEKVGIFIIVLFLTT